ncbi:MAG: potassium channel family protein [Dichotomicrobium sp.]
MTKIIRDLYYGRHPYARAFRFTLLAIDTLTLIYFIAVTALPQYDWLRIIDIVIGIYIALDLIARLVASYSPRSYFREISTWTDIAVLASLMVPAAAEDYLFLRILRIFRLLRSYHMLRDLRELSPFFRRHEEVVNSVVNLLVFVFAISALVFVLQYRTNEGINNYLDALYFTVSALTTTGFGDIVLEGTIGRLLSVVILVIGVGLFLRLIQVVFRPSKVHYTCPDCGLKQHDADAVHCKHCGRVLNIETEGDG